MTQNVTRASHEYVTDRNLLWTDATNTPSFGEAGRA
jgi:hypothetical protein